MGDNQKKFMNKIVRHIKTFAGSDEAAERESDPAAASDVQNAPKKAEPVEVEPVHEEEPSAQAPKPQLKVNTAPQLKETFLSKLTVSLSERSVFGSILIYALIVINLVGMTVFCRRSGLALTQSLLYKVHIDSISFQSFTFLQVSVLVSYIFSFIFGGIVIFALLRLGILIAQQCNFIFSHKLMRWILFLFMAIFAITALFMMIAGRNILSVSVCNWAAPLFAFGGGLCMYSLSLRRVEVF